jgi:hypothetical protein
MNEHLPCYICYLQSGNRSLPPENLLPCLLPNKKDGPIDSQTVSY